ncbi:hypothetical protein Aduo_011402 [Ancylostoma duodenale]
MEIIFNVILGIIGAVVIFIFALYFDTLIIITRWRKSNQFNTFFFRMWWNEAFMELFTLIFFTFTIYSRCFEFAVPIFLPLNEHMWWTKFAQITQEQINYVQATNVVLAVCGRLAVICLANSRKRMIVEDLSKFTIFFLQVTLPTLITVPSYFVYNFYYGLKGTSVPLLLSTNDKSYDQQIFLIGLIYRVSALLLCLGGYLFLYFKVRHNAKRAELNALIPGVCLVFALSAVLSLSVFRRFQIQESSPIMRVFFLTTMIWIPCVNVLVTTFLTSGLRKRLLHPFSPQSVVIISKVAKVTQIK